MESFKATDHKAFNGLCLAVIQSKGKAGSIKLMATAEGLPPASVTITAQ
jgi:beta-galactosidase